MVDVRRKPKETVSSLIRRFTKVLQQSGRIKEVKSNKYYHRKRKTNRVEKNTALMRVALTDLRRRLEKMGQYSEEKFQEEKQKLKQELDL